MDCKNCQNNLTETSKYCNACGAKVVKERITVKRLLSDVSQNIFGWDNTYFFTIKALVLTPGHLLREYFDGTRKKYVNPFAFLTIGMAINLFSFNAFDTEFLSLMENTNRAQIEWFAKTLGGPYASAEFQEKQLELSIDNSRFMLKYFNLLVVLLMPLYTFLAFLVYRKPYNYGEHLIVNSYVQGLSFLSTTVVFFVAILVHPAFYILTFLLLIFYYTYIYGKLYGLSKGQSVLKIIIFLGVLAGVFFSIFIVAVLITIAVVYILNRLG